LKSVGSSLAVSAACGLSLSGLSGLKFAGCGDEFDELASQPFGAEWIEMVMRWNQLGLMVSQPFGAEWIEIVVVMRKFHNKLVSAFRG